MKNEGSMKEKVKTWLKDPYNLAIIGVLIASFLIRLYKIATFILDVSSQILFFSAMHLTLY